MKQKHITIAICWFLLLITAPMLLELVGYREVAHENRKPQAFPELSWSGVRDGVWFQSLNKYIEDHLSLRGKMIAAYSRISLSVFRETGSAQTSLGKDGWLFYEESLQQACMEPEEISRRLHKLVEIAREEKRKNNVRMMWVIAPDKEAIYPEQLSADQYERSKCAVVNRHHVRQLLKAPALEPYFLGLWDALEKAKAEVTYPIYRQYDTHWNFTGASHGAHAVMEWISPGIWKTGAVRLFDRIDRSGDLGNMLGLQQRQLEEVYKTKLPGVKMQKREKSFCTPAGLKVRPETFLMVAEEDATIALVPGRSVIINDSFFTGLKPLIHSYFAQLDLAHFTELQKLDLPEISTCADTIIFESVERHFLTRTGEVIAQFGAQ